MAERIPVESSDLSSYFEGIEPGDIYLIPGDKGAEVWESYIESPVTSYFKLPDDNWVSQAEMLEVGDWQTAYNADRNEDLVNQLEPYVNWKKSATVYFLAKKSLVLETTWGSFLSYWDCFLAIQDDCPIIFAKGSDYFGLMFRPVGDVVALSRKKDAKPPKV